MMLVSAKGQVFSDQTGVFREIPILVSESGVVEPLVDYFLERSHDRSVAWQNKVTKAVKLFILYLQACPSENAGYESFRNFAQRLYTGTFNLKTGYDSSSLCWRPRSAKDSAQIIRQLSDFFDWLGEFNPNAKEFNPRYAGCTFDRMIDEKAYQYRRHKAFLGNLWSKNAASENCGYRVRAQRTPKAEKEKPPMFPRNRFEELLFDGFKVGGHQDYRGILITLLLEGAGFRSSEPFHLYVADVIRDPKNTKTSIVRIHHPVYGESPPDPLWVDERGHLLKGIRKEYLAERFGLQPRNQLNGSKKAGWKGGMHDSKYYKNAWWFLPQYGEWFTQIWEYYLLQIANFQRLHPFAFCNTKRNPKGAPYTLSQYIKAHARACERIGLTVSKRNGTTPHGHRHSYAKRLKDAGVHETYIRRFLHHTYLESQQVYTQPTDDELLTTLSNADKLLRTKCYSREYRLSNRLGLPAENHSNMVFIK